MGVRAACRPGLRATFDTTINDGALRSAILAEQQSAVDKYKVDSTPTFIVGEKAHAGEQPYDAIAGFVASAS